MHYELSIWLLVIPVAMSYSDPIIRGADFNQYVWRIINYLFVTEMLHLNKKNDCDWETLVGFFSCYSVFEVTEDEVQMTKQRIKYKLECTASKF